MSTRGGHDSWARRYAASTPGAGDPGWLRALRDEAIARFAALGFPSTRLEDWKYTRTQAFAKSDFAAWDEAAGVEVSAGSVDALAFDGFDCDRCVFVNGRFAAALSTPGVLSGSGPARSIARLRSEEPSELEGRLAALAAAKDDAFASLNTAFFDEGVFLHLPRGASMERPLHLVHLTTETGEPRVTHPRLLVAAEPGSRGCLLVDHVSLGGGGGARFTNEVIEASIDANAQLDLILLQRESDQALHVSRTKVLQQRDSRFASHTLTLGGQLVRNDLDVVLADEGAECTLNGLFLALGDRHVDNHTLVDHAMPHGTSHELYKGILGDRARGVFRGRVVVRPDAQKTSAEQSNHNMLMSEAAEIDTKPQLEIYADDVRCSHGATIGQLDPAALFFLRSRGLPRAEARDLLIQAFASEVTEALPDARLGESVRALIVGQLIDGAKRALEAGTGS